MTTWAARFIASWLPLTGQVRADLVAYIKTFSPRWSQGHGTPITIPPETPATVESVLRGRALFQKMECWKCHGPAGHGDGPSASTLTDSKDNPIRPYIADNLKPAEAWDLVHFLRTLQPVKTPESAAWKTWLKSNANSLKPIGPETQ